MKELLGLNAGRSLAEQFELVIGPFQHEFLGPFVIRQATRRRDKFDEILGIDSWRKTFTETKVLAGAIRAKIEALESAITPLEAQAAELPAKKEELQTTKTTLAQAETELASQRQQLKELEKRLQALDKREKELKELEKAIETLRERIANGHERIAKQKQLVTEAEQAQKVVEETAPGKKAFEQAERRLQQLREQEKIQRALEQEVAALKGRLGKLEERFKVASQAIEHTRQELDAEEKELAAARKALTVDAEQQALSARLPEIRANLDKLRLQRGQLEGRRAGLEEGSEKLAEGICPFFQEPCLNIAEKPPEDVFKTKFSELDQKLRSLQQQIQKREQEEREAVRANDRIREVTVKLEGLEARMANLSERRKANELKTAELGELRKEQDAARQQLDEKQKDLARYTNLQAEIEKAEQEKARHQEARDRFVANQQQAAERDRRRADLEKFENHLKTLQNELDGKVAAFSQAGNDYDASVHEQLRKDRDMLWGGVNALEQRVKGLNAEVARLSAEVDKLRKIETEIADKKRQITSWGQKAELVRFLRNRVFRNVSASLSERFREEISQRANRIYRTIAEADEELYWGDNYRIILRDMVDGRLRERSDDQLSGGQIMSAVVALRLALLQTIGARIAFFDEPTSNLDADRRENLARAFRAIDVGQEDVTEHWYDQLFLISHDVSFTEITDQVIDLQQSGSP